MIQYEVVFVVLIQMSVIMYILNFEPSQTPHHQILDIMHTE